jgi:hypothetical protein
VKRGHDATLADDVRGAGDARAGRGEAEDEAARAGAIVHRDEVGEARVAFGDWINGDYSQLRTSHALATLNLEIRPDPVGHSRCAVSAIVPTIRISPRARTTLTLV